MVINRELHHIIQKIFIDVRGYLDSDQLQVNCPVCQEREGLFHPDGKFNLEINTEKRVFKCWKCSDPEFKGSVGYLIKKYGSYNDFNTYKTFYGYYNETTKEYEEEDVKVFLPNEFISFDNMDINNPEHFNAYSYLVLDRKIDRNLIKKFNIGFCIEGIYKNRIIVPSYDKFKNLNFFIGRTWDKYEKTKYDIPKRVNKTKIIFNEYNINWDSTVYMFEGVFELLTMPVNSVLLLGKKISELLLLKLKQTKPYLVIVLDPDAFKDAVDIFQKIKSVYIDCEYKVKIVELPRNKKNFDLDEIRLNYGIDEVIKHLYNARDINIDDLFLKKITNEFSGYTKNNKYKKYNKNKLVDFVTKNY